MKLLNIRIMIADMLSTDVTWGAEWKGLPLSEELGSRWGRVELGGEVRWG